MATEEENKDTSKLTFVNNALSAPTIFVDGIAGLAFIGEGIRISYYESVLNHAEAEVQNRQVVNLVMPKSSYKAIVDHLKETLDDMVEKGHL